MGRGSGVAGGILATEVCAPLLLLCWLCCWPDDAKSDTSSGRHPGRAVVAHESGSRRRSSDFFGRRLGSSAVSLHLPSTSGHKKQALSAHRSHEEIGRRKSHNETHTEESRYHSAPSVIDEIVHRRDWERSTRELYIPLKPDNQHSEHNSNTSDSETSDRPPHAEPESSSIEDCKSNEQVISKPCKKHHTNIKSSRKKEKESTRDDIKDYDATEISNFYIGETKEDNVMLKNTKDEAMHAKSIYKAKDAKQSFNESLKSKERPKQTLVPLDEHHPRMFGFDLNDVIEQLDRSGAMHHSIESRISLGPRSVLPPPSVVPAGYEGAACYLASGEGAAVVAGAAVVGAAGGEGGAGGAGARGLRARHASDGDILAPPIRPESGAFSESDLDLELEAGEDRPPPYDELLHYVADHKETAI